MPSTQSWYLDRVSYQHHGPLLQQQSSATDASRKPALLAFASARKRPDLVCLIAP